MGHPKKLKKKYSTPSHPWQSARITGEKIILKEYGLKNKKEIWKMESLLKNFTAQAKMLIPQKTEQAEKEKKQLIDRLARIGLLSPGADLTAVLNLTLNDIMNRRLQTLVYKRRMAKTIKQARQIIAHEHISIGEKKITVPSYIVRSSEENMIVYAPDSGLKEEAHPIRIVEGKKAEQG